MHYSKQIKKEIGLLLMLERHKRGFHHKYLAKRTEISRAMIDWIELGADHNSWENYRRLLDFYKKDLKIELVDRPIIEEENHEI